MKKIIIFSLMIFLIHSIKSQETGTVGAALEISEDAINLMLMEQYNKAGFVSRINGSVQGITYDITLHLPYISLHTNQAKIHFGFIIDSNILSKVIEFEDNLSFTIPSVTDLTVKGISENFIQLVNSINIHDILKQVIIGAWNGLQLELYPMKLANTVENSQWLYDKSISMVDPYFSVSFYVLPGKLQILLNTHLEGKESFHAAIVKIDNKIVLRLKPSKQVEVSKVEIFNSAGQKVWTGENLGIAPKKGYLIIDCGNIFSNYQYFLISILFSTNNTFHVCNYKIPTYGGAYPNKTIN